MAIADLFLLSLVHIANLKYDGVIEVRGEEAEQQLRGRGEDRAAALSQFFGNADKDVPFACIRDGVSENLAAVARRGVPPMLR